MAASFPIFAPLFASATAGAGVKVAANNTPTSVSGSITITAPKECNAILVTNNGTADAGTGCTVFVRISTEAAPTATNADVPVPPSQSVLIAAPIPNGTIGIAALSAAATANNVYFTPVETKVGT